MIFKIVYNGSRWTKIYAFSDGSVQTEHRDDGNFADWEKEHMAEGQTAPPGW
ncbi:MAG: hypothetical protein H0X66_17130 [Verrucomicrobia bacterium]|nr:hypothetical protein [Verrucomicrobiota bacterium]